MQGLYLFITIPADRRVLMRIKFCFFIIYTGIEQIIDFQFT